MDVSPKVFFWEAQYNLFVNKEVFPDDSGSLSCGFSALTLLVGSFDL